MNERAAQLEQQVMGKVILEKIIDCVFGGQFGGDEDAAPIHFFALVGDIDGRAESGAVAEIVTDRGQKFRLAIYPVA